MEFRIADTFTDSLARLNGAEQKAVKTTAFDLQLNVSSPSLRFHRLDRARDPNFWSVRVNDDVRLIVHRTAASLLLCYVDHHDAAYSWAERRRIERHPTTGAAQLVELPERVERAPAAAGAPPPPKPPLFAGIANDTLLSYGVPAEWLDQVRGANEDTLFDIAEGLPQEAAEALLELATGGTPEIPVRTPMEADPFAHPDAQRRFRVLTNIEELERALDYPWDKWAVFLHPAQRRLVERDYNGPARVSGSAGTGKTIVAVHRAVVLARRHPDVRVLLTTFSKALANALQLRLRTLTDNEPEITNRIAVHPVTGIGYELHAAAFGQPNLAPPTLIEALLREAAAAVEGHRFTARFLLGEWREVVDAWHLASWDEYRDVARLGRKTRIGGKQREILWTIFDRVRVGLRERRAVTWPGLLGRVTADLAGGKSPFDFVVVDEAQDVGVAELRFLAALGGKRDNGLFFAGDLGQRIFQLPFSWRSRRGCARSFLHAARQLPHLAPDPGASRPAAADSRVRCRWPVGRPARHDLGLQRAGAADRDLRRSGAGGRSCRGLDCPAPPGRCAAARDRRLRPVSARAAPGESCGQAGRRRVGRAERQNRDHRRPAVSRHDAFGERAGIPRRRCDRVRRRDHPIAGAHRACRRRGRPRRSLRQRASLALRRLHPRPRPPARHWGQAGIRILG
jgi:mRNA-degrading endonuclease RelE of RelBE toxin-antitoxin system